MLVSLTLEDWKSFGPGSGSRNTVDFGPVTLLVGPNASGKSNVLDALRFLQGAALDLPLGDVLRGRWEGQREVWPPIRGHVAEAPRFGRPRFGLETIWNDGDVLLEHRLDVSTDDEVAVERERLWYGDPKRYEYLFDTEAPTLGNQSGRVDGGGIRVAMRQSGGGGRSPTAIYSSLRSLLGQVKKQPRVADDVIKRAEWVRGSLRSAAFVDIRPSMMRDYRPENGGELGTSGENISPVLHALAERPGVLEDVVDWLSELCAPNVETIAFDRTQLREVMMFLVEKGGHRVSARSLSDGTLRFLGHIVALLTCPEGAFVILEEPDVGLHPTRIRLLAELFEQVARDRGIQVLATTHSPTLLAHLSPQALGDVVAFARDPESGLSVCSRLKRLAHFETLRDAKDLEHLVSTGWLERAL